MVTNLYLPRSVALPPSLQGGRVTSTIKGLGEDPGHFGLKDKITYHPVVLDINEKYGEESWGGVEFREGVA